MLTLFTNKTFRWCAGRRLVPAKTWPEVLVAAGTRLFVYPNIMAMDITMIAGANFLAKTGTTLDTLDKIDPDILLQYFAELAGILTAGYMAIYPVIIAWCIHSWSRQKLRILSNKDSDSTAE